MKKKILKNQLKEAQAEIVKLREENKHMKTWKAKHLDLCEEALENGKIMVNESLPLHKQGKNLYNQNKVLRTKDKMTKEQMEKRNLNLLDQATM
jgi:hypothetical protein